MNKQELQFFECLSDIESGNQPTILPMWYTIKHLFNELEKSPSLDKLRGLYRQPPQNYRVYTK